MRLVKNTVLFSLGLSLLFLAIFFAMNTYIPATGYTPAVLLDRQGEPISLREKDCRLHSDEQDIFRVSVDNNRMKKVFAMLGAGPALALPLAFDQGPVPIHVLKVCFRVCVWCMFVRSYIP